VKEKKSETSTIKEDTDKIPTEEEKGQILKKYHDAPIGGHQGEFINEF